MTTEDRINVLEPLYPRLLNVKLLNNTFRSISKRLLQPLVSHPPHAPHHSSLLPCHSSNRNVQAHRHHRRRRSRCTSTQHDLPTPSVLAEYQLTLLRPAQQLPANSPPLIPWRSSLASQTHTNPLSQRLTSQGVKPLVYRRMYRIRRA